MTSCCPLPNRRSTGNSSAARYCFRSGVFDCPEYSTDTISHRARTTLSSLIPWCVSSVCQPQRTRNFVLLLGSQYGAILHNFCWTVHAALNLEPHQRGLDQSARRRRGRSERKERSLVTRVRPEAKAWAATSMSIAARGRPRFQEAEHRSA